MPHKFFWLVWRNMARSKTRLAATLGGCAIGAFIICFFLAAKGSVDRMLDVTGADQNLVVSQKDRF